MLLSGLPDRRSQGGSEIEATDREDRRQNRLVQKRQMEENREMDGRESRECTAREGGKVKRGARGEEQRSCPGASLNYV